MLQSNNIFFCLFLFLLCSKSVIPKLCVAKLQLSLRLPGSINKWYTVTFYHFTMEYACYQARSQRIARKQISFFCQKFLQFACGFCRTILGLLKHFTLKKVRWQPKSLENHALYTHVCRLLVPSSLLWLIKNYIEIWYVSKYLPEYKRII